MTAEEWKTKADSNKSDVMEDIIAKLITSKRYRSSNWGPANFGLAGCSWL